MQKTCKTQAFELQAPLMARLPQEVAQRVRRLQYLLLTKHNVVLECLDHDERTAKMVADKLDLSFTSNPINIRQGFARSHRNIANASNSSASVV